MAQVYQLIPLPQGPFAKLSLLERALYGLLYDRCKMSVNNMLNGNGRFYDEQLEEVYCVYNQNDLAKTLGVSVAELLSGECVLNRNRSGNMFKSRFYDCPVCGNVICAMGEGAFSCCGVTLPP